VPYKGHDKSGTEAVEKKSGCVPARMAVGKSKTTNIIFSNGFAFAHCHARFFSFAGVQLLAWPLVGTHNQKVLAHRFFLVPGFAGKGGRACVSAVRWGIGMDMCAGIVLRHS
jgi:hypothetical protein